MKLSNVASSVPGGVTRLLSHFPLGSAEPGTARYLRRPRGSKFLRSFYFFT
jgi:hypothetical protein